MKIVYCGFGRAALEGFYLLINSIDVEMSDIIVFTHDVEQNKEFINHLRNNNIEYYVDSINNHDEDLLLFKPNLLLSIYYRFIIKPETLKLVNYKAMNLHPSYLPAYRGTKSSVWALLNDEKETGITFHYITETVDGGNIILQKKLNILDTDTAYSLYNKLISMFVQNFPEALNRLIKDFKGEAQQGKITYYERKLPFNGEMDFDKTTYPEAKLFVRALYFPPHKGAIFGSSSHEKVEVKSLEELEKYEHLFKEKK